MHNGLARTVARILSLTSWAVAAAATQPIAYGQDLKVRPNAPDFERLKAQVYSLPPQLSGYFLSRISEQARDKQEKLQFLRDAVAYARLSSPYDYVVVGSPTTSVQQSLGGERGGLEGLTVQLSAIEALASVEPSEAFDLLENLIVPPTGAIDCDTVLVPNVGKQIARAYSVANILAPRVKNGADRRRRFLFRLLSSAESSLEIPAMLLIAADDHWSDAESLAVEGLIAALLGRMADGDPAFTIAAAFNDMSRRMVMFLKGIARRSHSTDAVLTAYREYLLKNRVRRCANSMFYERQVLNRVPSGHPVKTFNSMISDEGFSFLGATRKNLRPIEADAFGTIASTGARQKQELILDTADGRELANALGELLEKPAPTKAKEVDEFLQRCMLYLKESPRTSQSPLQAVAEVGYFFERVLQLSLSPNTIAEVSELFVAELARLWDRGGVDEIAMLYLKDLFSTCSRGNGTTIDRSVLDARRTGAEQGARGAPGTVVTLVSLFGYFQDRSGKCSP